MNNAHQSQMKKQKLCSLEISPLYVLWFWRINFLEENRQKKSNHQNSHNRQKKRIVVGNQTGLSLLMFVANDDAK